MGSENQAKSTDAPKKVDRAAAAIERGIIQFDLMLEIQRIIKMEAWQNPPFQFPDVSQLDRIDRRILTKSIFSFIEASIYATKSWIAATGPRSFANDGSFFGLRGATGEETLTFENMAKTSFGLGAAIAPKFAVNQTAS